MAEFVSEKGPWTAEIDGNDVHVCSADFTHDVLLVVKGDFASVHDKHAYGRAIAAALNAAMPLMKISEEHARLKGGVPVSFRL